MTTRRSSLALLVLLPGLALACGRKGAGGGSDAGSPHAPPVTTTTSPTPTPTPTPTESDEVTPEQLDLARLVACDNADPLPCRSLKKRDALRLFAARCRGLQGTRCDDPPGRVLDDLAAACKKLGAECAALAPATRTAACRTAFGAPPPCPFEDALADRPARRLPHSLVRDPPSPSAVVEMPAGTTVVPDLPPSPSPSAVLMPVADAQTPARLLFATFDAARQAGYGRFLLAVHRASAAIGDGLPETCPREGAVELGGHPDASGADEVARTPVFVDVAADGTVTINGGSAIPPATVSSASAKRARTGACFEAAGGSFDLCAYWTWVEEYLDTCVRLTAPGPIPDFKAYHLALCDVAVRSETQDLSSPTAPRTLIIRPADDVPYCTIIALLDLARFRDFAAARTPLFPDARLAAAAAAP